MCGRFGLWAAPEQIKDHFNLQELRPLSTRYNIAPSQEILAVGKSAEGIRKATMLHWGLVPHWSKEAKSSYKMINARAESIFSKPAYRVAARKRRCLIPASCFFEWKRKVKGAKQPYCIRPKHDQLFAFAGLYEHWEDQKSGQKIDSCTIVTTRANDTVQELHDRMPVIILNEDYDLWLDKEIQEPDRLKPLLEPVPSQAMEIFEVDLKVNNPANDSEEVIIPI